MYRFSDTKAYKKLDLLSQKPFDLTALNALTPARIEKFVARSSGYRLFYGTERITDEVMNVLRDLVQESDALKKMHAMQNGEVINQIESFASESRPVLHTATRDFFDNPNQSKAALEATNLAKRELDKLEKFIDLVTKENKFTDLILIGIGGSELGPKANYQALSYLQRPNTRIFFLANVDPDDAAEILKKCDLKKTLVLVVSKSGNTLETLTNETFIKESMIKQALIPKEHFVAITTEGSPMDDKEKYLESFYLVDSVGGRYSSTSMVGGVLLAFAFGFDVFMEFLKGANAMDKAALQPDIHTNLPLPLERKYFY